MHYFWEFWGKSSKNYWLHRSAFTCWLLHLDINTFLEISIIMLIMVGKTFVIFSQLCTFFPLVFILSAFLWRWLLLSLVRRKTILIRLNNDGIFHFAITTLFLICDNNLCHLSHFFFFFLLFFFVIIFLWTLSQDIILSSETKKIN